MMVVGAAGTLLSGIGLLAIILVRLGEVSRRTTCANNLRQIGRAGLSYHDVNKAFPSATSYEPDELAFLAPWRRPPYVKRLSWMVTILPYLERPRQETTGPDKGPRKGAPGGPGGPGGPGSGAFGALYERFDLRQPWEAPANLSAADTTVQLYLCPAHPDYDAERKPALTYYVGIAGVGAEAAFLPKGSPMAGFFGYERQLRIDRREGDDLPAGAARTMMCAETAQRNGPWVAGDGSTVRPLNPADTPYIGLGRQFGGFHPGGANLLMVDGHVEFFAEGGNPRVFEKLSVVSDEW
jgi:prepilin-type processing-associated H-X9-DG protein